MLDGAASMSAPIEGEEYANYQEAGCHRVLFAHGFDRVAETSPYHHSWGDALYVRRTA